MTRWKRALIGAAAGFAAMAGVASAEVPESSDPIVIAINEWTGQHITAHIAGNILQRMGYNVEFVTAGVLPMAPAIADGEITLGLEMWDNNLGDYFPSLLADGSIADAGDVGLDAREGWLYPKYMEEQCPGLPAWDTFIACSELFSTPETFPNGRVLAYPADWGHRSADIIAETGIPFDAVPAGSEGALVAELNSAVEREAPIVMMFWSPHWVLSTLEYGWVDMPQDIAEKYSLVKVPVWNVVWPGMKDTWPAAYRLLGQYTLDNTSQEAMMDLIDNQGQDLDEVTKAWVDENRDTWQPWVDSALAGS